MRRIRAVSTLLAGKIAYPLRGVAIVPPLRSPDLLPVLPAINLYTGLARARGFPSKPQHQSARRCARVLLQGPALPARCPPAGEGIDDGSPPPRPDRGPRGYRGS